MRFAVVIPARFASTRLPGKVLLDIGGKPMLQHVYERAVASGANPVIIATDDDRVAERARRFGAQVTPTGAEHSSGTERIAEVIEVEGLSPECPVVNLQADEPFMPPDLIRQVAEDLLAHSDASVATLCEPIVDAVTLFDPNAVKVVRDQAGYALYFSRAPIPWHREGFQDDYRNPSPRGGLAANLPIPGLHFRHVGIYAFSTDYVARYVATAPSELERCESLEQLRVLFTGGKIYVGLTDQSPGPGVDTEDDLARARAWPGAGAAPV